MSCAPLRCGGWNGHSSDIARSPVGRLGRARTNGKWSGRRDLNPRPSRWQRDALPLSYSRRSSILNSWNEWAREDLNLYPLRDGFLRPARLPVPPLARNSLLGTTLCRPAPPACFASFRCAKQAGRVYPKSRQLVSRRLATRNRRGVSPLAQAPGLSPVSFSPQRSHGAQGPCQFCEAKLWARPHTVCVEIKWAAKVMGAAIAAHFISTQTV